MSALRFDGTTIRLEDIPIPHPAPGEALVRVALAGVCSTDIEITKGYMGFTGTLGHEFVGIVVECDSRRDIEGRRVVGEINAGCGLCKWCARGLGRHCPNRTVLGILGRDGAFAEYLTLPAANLHLVPDNVPDRSAVFVEPLAAALEILEQLPVKRGCEALLIGAGRLGQLIARALDREGCVIDVLSRSEEKINRMEGLPRRAWIGRPPPPASYSLVVEASGSPEGWTAAVNAVEPRGYIVLKSTFTDGFVFNPAPLVINEVTLIGSRCGPFPRALDVLSAGLNPQSLIDAEYPLSEGVIALEEACRPGVIKVLIYLDSDRAPSVHPISS